MAGLHFSPFLPPFPGVGRCKAAGADTCPYGGMDMHIVTEYLPPEMQEQLLGDLPLRWYGYAHRHRVPTA